MESLLNRLGILSSEKFIWILELFFIVLAALAAGHLVNKIIDRLEKHAAQTASVWDDALIEACRRPLVWLIWILGINFRLWKIIYYMEKWIYSKSDFKRNWAEISSHHYYQTNDKRPYT